MNKLARYAKLIIKQLETEIKTIGGDEKYLYVGEQGYSRNEIIKKLKKKDYGILKEILE
jgi:hypothetical protein